MPRLRWLHRIGYATTAIVAAELLGVAVLVARGARDTTRLEAEVRADTRTRAGPYRPVFPRVVRPDERDILPLLPAPGPSQSGWRVVATPMHTDRFAYGLILSPGAARARGTLLLFETVPPHLGASGTVRRTAFTVPAAEATRFLAAAAAIADANTGDPHLCLDGTPFVFELARAGRVVSGGGNAACSPHYASLLRLALGPVRRLVPPADLPSAAAMAAASTPATPR